MTEMTAASCPTALSTLCGQLTFRLACCREHSAFTGDRTLQPLDLAYGTLFRSRHHLRTVQTTAEGTLFREAWTRVRSVTSDMRRLGKNTHLFTYSLKEHQIRD